MNETYIISIPVGLPTASQLLCEDKQDNLPRYQILCYIKCLNYYNIKGALPQNIFFILKSSRIGHKNSLQIMGVKRFFFFLNGRIGHFKYLLVPEPISSLHVRSEVCIAPFHVRSKVCQFDPHMDGSNVDFARHMEGNHADFAPHMDWSHSFRDQKSAKFC